MPNLKGAASCFKIHEANDQHRSTSRNRHGQPVLPQSHSLVPVLPMQGDIPEEVKGRVIVELRKLDGQTLSLTIAGGTDKGHPARITKLRPNGLAAKSDLLQVGDIIAGINDVQTARLKHHEIVSCLKEIKNNVFLQIEYELPPATLGTAMHGIRQKTTQVQLTRDELSFGYTVRGGHDHAYDHKTRPLVITHVRPHSPCDRCGIIKPGDRLLAIDNIVVEHLVSLDEALTKIMTGGETATFTIEYDCSIVEAVEQANGPLMVEVVKAPGLDLGINLSSNFVNSDHRHAIFIESVTPATIADRCGALHAGDEILSIDGQQTAHLSLPEVQRLLQSISDRIRIEILPVRHHRLAIEAPRLISGSSNQLGHMTPYRSSTMQPQNSILAQRQYHQHHQAMRCERAEIELLSDGIGFGFVLQGSIFSTELLDQPPTIAEIERGSIADASGKLQPGDRLISINGVPTEETTLDDVNTYLHEAVMLGRVVLGIEYDVAESIVPSSGVFQVKLVKGVNQDDIGVQVVDNNKENERGVVIIKIKAASISCRAGTLNEGDIILAIDGITVHSQKQAYEILARCEEYVRLKIKKIDQELEDAEDEQSDWITFTVELKRRGGQALGFTISGTEDPLDLITVSNIAPGGLADRTGTLRKEDEILAINGVPLRTRPLSEAIHLLQTSNEAVVLKIRRNTSALSNIAQMASSLPGGVKSTVGQVLAQTRSPPTVPLKNSNRSRTNDIDSALESWDGTENGSSGSNSNHLKKAQQTQSNPANPRHSAASSQGMGRSSSSSRQGSSATAETTSTMVPTHQYNNQNSGNVSVLSAKQRRPLATSTPHTHRFGSTKSQSSDRLARASSAQSGQQPAEANNTDQAVHHQQLEVVLFRESNEDFGFSISDGLSDNGVYVNSIRDNGPASQAGMNPYDRIIQVNKQSVTDLDCQSVLPLLASSGNRLNLIVSRSIQQTN